MLRTRKLWMSVLSVMLVLTVVLSGCGKSDDSKDTASNTTDNTGDTKTDTTKTDTPKEDDAAKTGIDTSKPVELQFYMLGDAPKDLSKIQDLVNQMAKEELNTTVKFNYTTWTDWDQKYKLLLSSGQPIDLIFTADWTQFQSYAKKGAFQDITDILPKAAPELQKYVPADMWDAVKIDGKIYTVPATYKEYVTLGFVYREDLRVKYNLPKPVDMATFEEYLDGIKKNEPDMMPLSMNSNVRDNLIAPIRDLTHDAIGATPYGLGITYKDPSNVYSYWGSDEQVQDLTIAQRWQQKGFFAKNVLNDKDTLQEPVVSGKAAAILGDNPTRFNDTRLKMKSAHPDWELAYFPFPLAKGYATPVHPIHNGFAVPKSSKNAERALAFYEKMVLDKRYNQLTEYGVEGTNYKVTDGYYEMIGDSTSNGFPRESMNGWAWRNPEYMLFDKDFDGVKDIFASLDKIQSPDKFTGFAEDYTPYQAEKAAVEQVESQYFAPLYAGLVDNIQEGLQTAMSKAKQAGLEKIHEEYKKQWEQYVTTNGIK
ncbi:putative aldouronate transport system substrate-binding protein [Paenibacillus cellulosilyticus]|uniref:Putative aldouronate transport system substrate-binding protein n=1 Tax=Paenibacillus cellulosilyticus TaxID=375489 RepID=A0A2V2YR14_9BACL|nr:extracellular solute-binding protein [Paenibacillus cellulosilyticus]PWV97328.1 putative aldouronate transport system substrate-binding protein [Paenibacillus cellulosilyticus]QKS47472.1 extracellular solute-binding protein [Paenibacillus cellulosilyticus]